MSYTAPVKATTADLTENIFTTFRQWIDQRPGLDPRNYDRSGYASESRSIAKQKKEAHKALTLAMAYPFNAEAMIEATRAFSGRLQLVIMTRTYNGSTGYCPSCKFAPGKEHKYNCTGGTHVACTAVEIDYCTGQYWPTEYRAAAAAVLNRYIDEAKPKELPRENAEFHSIADLRDANERAGGKWFSRDNMRFFRSRLLPTLYHGHRLIWFVSTEEGGWGDGNRRATVRVFDPADASVNSAGEHGEYTNPADARNAAREFARRDRAGEHKQHTDERTECPFCGHYGRYCKGDN